MSKRNAELRKMSEKLDQLEHRLGATPAQIVATAEQAEVEAAAAHVHGILERYAELKSGGHETATPQPPNADDIAQQILTAIEFDVGVDPSPSTNVDGDVVRIEEWCNRMTKTRRMLCTDPQFRQRVYRRLYKRAGPDTFHMLAARLHTALDLPRRSRPEPVLPTPEPEAVEVFEPHQPNRRADEAKPVYAAPPDMGGPRKPNGKTLTDIARSLR